jgi:hypothetical protein
VAEEMTRPASQARCERHRRLREAVGLVTVGLAPGPPGPDWPRRALRRPHEGAKQLAEVTSARCTVESRACLGQPAASRARFRAVQLESEGFPKQRAVSCIQSVLFLTVEIIF